MSEPVASGRQPVRVAVLGCGNVGSQVVRILHEQADELAARVGAPLELVGIGVRRAGRERESYVDPALVTTDSAALAARTDVDVVVELIGGIEPARSLILSALEHGASVVTGNKALMARDGTELVEQATAHGADLYDEASVAGAIPILRPLRESLSGDEVLSVTGIVNGTTNYILDRMDTTGAGFSEALAEAQELGFAEADPTADVDGFDAAAKATILAGLAFHTRLRPDDVHREGIGEVTSADIASAKEMGCVVKMLAICTLDPATDEVSARVHPAMIPRTHPLANVRGAFNAVFVHTAAAGDLMFYGRGAGGAPTASAVLGDLVTAARNKVRGVPGGARAAHRTRPVRPIEQTMTRYHVSLDVEDRAGVLEAIAHCFAEADVSIQTVRQSGRGADAQLVVVTHPAPDGALSRTVRRLEKMPMVRGVSSVMRVEGES